MNPLDAALSATYPVVALMGAMILMRFFPLLQSVESHTKPLICSTLVIVIAVMYEQLLYGFGRFSGTYINIATSPWLVGVGKVMYMLGFSYMLYAFWLLSPKRPRLWVSMAFTFTTWLLIFASLLF